MNSYEEKQERRKERLEARAERLARQGAAKIESGMERLRAIPFGQPILVGHHSEKRDRNYRAKAGNSIDKGMEMTQAAREVAARAAAVGTGGVSSDDPEAIVKLKGQLASLEANQRLMAAINKAWRAAGKPRPDNLEGWRKIADHPEVMMNVNDLSNARTAMARDFLERAPFPPYALSNNNANISRIKGRIEHLKRNATRETKEEEKHGVRIVENAEANRLQLFFPGKPSEAVRATLKGFGFRWAPSEGAWQRQLSNGARYAAECVLKKMEETV